MLCTLLWAALPVACTQDPVRPVAADDGVDRPGAATATSTSSPTTSAATESTAAPSTGASDVAGVPGGRPDGSTSVGQVDLVLDRYDEALTQLAADPGVSTTPEDPRRQAWDRVVVAGTALSEGLLAQVRQDALAGTRLLPASDGRSYRHRALVVSEPEPGRRQFTWCSYSAGVRVAPGSDPSRPEVVVDDGLGHAHGVGELVDVGAGWQLASLDQLDLAVLPAGSSDPCEAEQAEAGPGPTGTERTP